MNWYFPHIPLLLIAVLVWAMRETLRTGSVERWGVRVKRSTQPVTFWAFIVTYMLWIVLMAGVEARADTRYPRLSRGPDWSLLWRSSCTVSAINGPPPIVLKCRRKA